MSGCTGCPQLAGDEDTGLQTVLMTAKQHAVTNEKNVFIYKDKTGTWQFMEEEEARAGNILPTGGIVSYMQPITS